MYFESGKQEAKNKPTQYTMYPMYPEKQNTLLQHAVYLVSLVVALCWAGWVFSALWEWFISPILSLRPISVPEAIGLIVTIGFVLARHQDKRQELNWDSIQDRIVDWVLRPLVALVVGAIVNAFV